MGRGGRGKGGREERADVCHIVRQKSHFDKSRISTEEMLMSKPVGAEHAAARTR